MNKLHGLARGTVAMALLIGLAACSGMSQQGKSTAVGAGIGAVGGAVLTGGSAAVLPAWAGFSGAAERESDV